MKTQTDIEKTSTTPTQSFICKFCECKDITEEVYFRKHESTCLYNPDNKCCYTCKNYTKRKNKPVCLVYNNVVSMIRVECEFWQLKLKK